jgi:hypothetical protein
MHQADDKKKVSHERLPNTLVPLPWFLVLDDASQSDVADQRAIPLPEMQTHVRRAVEIAV